MARSQGDPRVVFVLNVVLSATFCYAVLRGLDFVGAVEFSWPLMAGTTAALVVLTHIVTR
ncbi:hypothetical protein [Halalkalicoccus sp. NIPERK01]|uniref:hypothetical protein n=1 Tax=Halalkalicoccus sp. NIPERK01 TaxID=3053469 RepID=UPI00256F29A3|nr:hypothetical protein [Halalkalicoccus sp. NIPERK01]MDL5362007.1 hypothetical protein [Halalkalicoccus sp. NIPERK01]